MSLREFYSSLITDQKELAETRKRRRQLAELEAHIAAAASDFELKKHNLEQTERAQAERARLKETITSECEAVEHAGKRVDEVRQQQKEARSQLGKLRAGVRETETAVTLADEARKVKIFSRPTSLYCAYKL